MKKVISFLLCLILLSSAFTAYAASPADTNSLTVGVTTPFSGAFSTDLWGTNAADMDIRELLHGYELVSWDSAQASFAINPTVVSNFKATDTLGAGHRYTFMLKRDLTYSDGSPITAKDYAFSILLNAAPQMEELGGAVVANDEIQGVDNYRKGRTEYISGVRLVNDYTLEITLKPNFEPNFYFLGDFYIKPYPIQEIAPGCEVRSSDKGVCIYGVDTDNKPIFTKELLAKTFLDEKTGYMTNPKVVSGPYTLESYDAASGVVVLRKNDRFKGDMKGNVPSIGKLTVKTLDSRKASDALKNGDVDLLNRIVDKDSIDTLKNNMNFKSSDYKRSGLSFLSFCCEQPAVANLEVRKAIAYCFDRKTFAKDVVGDYGETVHGLYGLGQWMAQAAQNQIAAPSQLTDWEKTAWGRLNLNGLTRYDFSVDAANKLLDQYGWKLNDDGVREKTVGGQKVQLKLKLYYQEGSIAEEALKETLVKPLAEAGIELTMKAYKSEELLKIYYRQEERDCDMIYMASNFNILYDPAENFAPEESYQGVYNRTGIKDQTLYNLALQMRKTPSGDVLGYCRAWIKFQERFTQVLPMVPAYSNDYYDFYVPELKDYNPSAYQTWSKAILSASLK